MTIKATFPDGTVMMLGDSYRKWWDQLAELCQYLKLPRPTVMKCPTGWISYGGLKWCAESEFGECLKDEGQGRTGDDFATWRPLNQIERRNLEKHIREFPQNVKGHASPGHAPKIDQTASSASHVPPCSASLFCFGMSIGGGKKMKLDFGSLDSSGELLRFKTVIGENLSVRKCKELLVEFLIPIKFSSEGVRDVLFDKISNVTIPERDGNMLDFGFVIPLGVETCDFTHAKGLAAYLKVDVHSGIDLLPNDRTLATQPAKKDSDSK